MSTSESNASFQKRADRLRADLLDQGQRVRMLVEMAIDAAFEADNHKAQRAIDLDDAIDRVDVDIEKACVALLADVIKGGANAAWGEPGVRAILLIVKVNNELERIADMGVSIGEQVPTLTQDELPRTLRVMANSVIGILRDALRTLETFEEGAAMRVLASEDATETFKAALIRDVQERLCAGTMGPAEGFAIQEIATRCESMGDHCTNIAEQALYTATGKIVRHMAGKWEEVELEE
jgi:phosphate transport system protein